MLAGNGAGPAAVPPASASARSNADPSAAPPAAANGASSARAGGASGTAASSTDLSPEALALISKLKSIDTEVRAHEQAHLAAAGGLALSGASYTYERGPNGVNYAVGGEVQIDTSPGRTPEETIERARRVQAAALAPADPSGADRAVAAEAQQQELEARAELAAESAQLAASQNQPAQPAVADQSSQSAAASQPSQPAAAGQATQNGAADQIPAAADADRAAQAAPPRASVAPAAASSAPAASDTNPARASAAQRAYAAPIPPYSSLNTFA